jgi:dTDP-4-amino-4,6-dideoxygalactose transaminase
MGKLEEFCRTECRYRDRKLYNKSTGRQVKAIVVVHVFGNMADMPAVMDIAGAYNLTVIEDAAEALGTCYLEGRYRGRYAGTIADMGVYSFNGNKIITTGGGGAVIAKDDGRLERARYLSAQAKDDAEHFLHHAVGYNYRMTNFQAALGVAQLEQLESFINVKTDNYRLYKNSINGRLDGFRILDFRDGIRPNCWFYSLYITNPAKTSREELMRTLADKNIQTRPVWGLIHEQKPYRGSQAYRIEKAPVYQSRIVNLPCSSNLSADEVRTVVRAIGAFP